MRNSSRQKFRFCGEGDCPDWVLAEIISTLSNLSIENLEKLSDLVAARICGGTFEESGIKLLTSTLTNEGKTAVACIHFMLINAARYNCTESIFGEEIQQLGLPKEHAAAMCSVLQKRSGSIRQKLIDKAFRINELQCVRNVTSSGETPANCATLELKISQELVEGLPKDTTHIVNLERSQMIALLEELKVCRDVMDKYENKN
ncbi:COMM domain-containing protein 4 isoform X2 [Drosophila guanche]|uniref:Blast:COMM domain-containing protein 4 n=1 Tax=Drosophila guanche TaxID=7266 RepID=A0A3B0J3Y1_DROGU|nr:COMM domain-containing protein 4 isoform X1 [Drosophila guanche]XP_034122860.1 COMM domain-containing protein 4 isoform X2 [Drosophila guanche]SPP76075.1 blast:COMM domain-containing protein 4 [Drosophila guanche]